MIDHEITAAASWPAQHRAALVVVVHVDADDPLAHRDGHALGLDYAATGLPRLLRICDDLGIEVTTGWSTRALASHPQLARSAHQFGHELSWSTASDLAIALPTSPPDLLVEITGQASPGRITSLPGVTNDGTRRRTAEELSDPVPPWIINGAGGDIPVIVREATAEESSVQVPISPYWIDATWLDPRHPGPPSSLLEAWSASLASIRAEGGLMTIVLHPHIAGRPGFTDAIVRFLDEVIASGDVWIARADHLALWWKANSEQEI